MSSGINLILRAALVVNILTALPLMASIADYAARVDPAGLGSTMRIAESIPAVASALAGPSQGGEAEALYPLDITIPEHYTFKWVWVPPEEGYPGYWQWQWVLVPENTVTIWVTAEELENMCTEEPIDTASGNNFFTEQRLSVPCPGIPLDVDLKYQSITNRSEGMLGKGWHHSYEWMLEDQTRRAVLHMAEGGKLVFEQDINGIYQSPEQSDWELEATTNGFAATWPTANLTYSFSTNGQLTS